MSCPIPIRIVNPHYKKMIDAGVSAKDFVSRDDYYIDVPCGRCYHCRKSYKTQWNLRLQHEFSSITRVQQNNSYFVTLTFSDEHLPSKHPSKRDVSPFVRKFLERVRKKYNVSVRHWIVSEYGDNTQRFHFHGILFDVPFPIWQLEKYWSYGFVTYSKLTPKRITYVTTYVNKQIKGLLEDEHLRQYVFTSPGIGKNFLSNSDISKRSHYDGVPVPFTYLNGRPYALPRYYRQKLFTEQELKTLKLAYFKLKDDAEVPPPPYYLGRNKYTDYTLYLADCRKLKHQYNNKYGKR